MSGRSLGTDGHLLTAFREGLKSTGYIDGQNVVVDVRWADGDFGKVPGLLQELLALKPQVVVSVGGNPVALAIKQANLALPVVFSVGGDPVQMNLVKTLNRPEGNLTGITLLASELDVKRLELLREMVRTETPFVGICFGHQAIAHAFGGRVDAEQRKRRAALRG